MNRLLLAWLFLSVMLAPGYGQSVLTRAPKLALTDLEGRTVRLGDYKGKVLLVNFWATWCPPCRAELPDLVRWQRRYKRQGLQIIGITYPPQTRSAVRRFVRRYKVNYPIALGTKETKRLFHHAETLPLTVIIDRQGNVRDLIEGILLPEEFEEKIKPLLAGEKIRAGQMIDRIVTRGSRDRMK